MEEEQLFLLKLRWKASTMGCMVPSRNLGGCYFRIQERNGWFLFDIHWCSILACGTTVDVQCPRECLTREQFCLENDENLPALLAHLVTVNASLLPCSFCFCRGFSFTAVLVQFIWHTLLCILHIATWWFTNTPVPDYSEQFDNGLAVSVFHWIKQWNGWPGSTVSLPDGSELSEQVMCMHGPTIGTYISWPI